MSDEIVLSALLASAREGDKIAYRQFLMRTRVWLLRRLSRRVPPDRIEDVVQETLLSVHRKLSSHDPDRPVLPWLSAIARYRWIDHLRRLKIGREVILEDDFEAHPEEPDLIARLSLEKLFAILPTPQVIAIKMVKLEGRSVEEASMATGQSVPLIKTNIHRGLKRLAAHIEESQEQ